ncbi:MAG: hypothetical protein NC311_17605 [Muribaculaceae bacterium]|nr:hypothetical protein [Muribaculaceae bacterium]
MTKEKGIGSYRAIVVCGGAFLAGALGGGALAALMGTEDQAAFSDFFLGYRSALSGGLGLPSLGALLWSGVKWPVLAFFLGFTALGIIMLPFLFALRGFLLSYCIAGLVRAMEGQGALLALALFGFEAVFALPILFVLGIQSWDAARALKGHLFYTPKLKSPYVDGYWLRCLLCAILLVFGTLAENAALPSLLKAVAG